ncbi:hypothetical protein PIB30_095163 [Stylosanthes scabra]|uniref:CCHC-type domain-containing protein n=1 Tax=Stylosanthes scabra TaxID=79078 RepID=A0ABU6ZUE0_9FABA|nr:hypothetical protein [Stylosanthes scabra]
MVSAVRLEDFYEVTDYIVNKTKEILSRVENNLEGNDDRKASPPRRGVKDPRKVRTKGCGRTDASGQKRKRVVYCSICNKAWHNCRNCPEKEMRSLQDRCT